MSSNVQCYYQGLGEQWFAFAEQWLPTGCFAIVMNLWLSSRTAVVLDGES